MSETQQLLEFSIGENRYGVSIRDVDEIVEKTSLTPLPQSPDHIEGVMDLRGETTTIVSPKKVFEAEGANNENRVIIFDTDGQSVGWLVDAVHEVNTVDNADVEQVNQEEDSVQGVVHHEDRFVIVVEPGAINSRTEETPQKKAPA